MRRAAVFTLLVLIWEAVSRAEIVDPRLFPPPSLIIFAFAQWAGTGELLRDVVASLWRVSLGFLIGGLSGVFLGLLTGRFASAARYLAPIIQALRPLPPVAIIPLVIVWLGIGNTAKLFSIAFAVFFPVWLNTHLGATCVPMSYLRSARLLSRSPLRIAWRVLLPSILPSIVAGLRTSIALAFVMTYVTELAGASAGIGYQISISHLAYRIDRMVAALVVLAAAGALFDGVFTRLVRFTFPWLRGSGTE
jgi:ABC-type nitrate/sulfonate/bicarbonate transport system permease component